MLDKKLLKIAEKFRRDMQRMCDKPISGITSISISCPSVEGGKSFTIAETKNPRSKNMERARPGESVSPIPPELEHNGERTLCLVVGPGRPRRPAHNKSQPETVTPECQESGSCTMNACYRIECVNYKPAKTA